MKELKAIAQCQEGDMEAFTVLYDAHIRSVYKFIYYKTHHKETAEDITSQTFMKAMEKISTFDPDKASFKTWLYQIARNTVIDHYRQTKELSNIEDAWDLSSREDLVTDTNIKLQIETVQEHLQKLKAEQREIILLRVWGGYSFNEIAEMTGKTEAACKMTFKRSVEKLKGLMAVLALLIYFID